MRLCDYIDENFAGSKIDFAKFIGKPKQRITEMLKKGYIVVDGKVYSKRFDLPDLPDHEPQTNKTS